MKTVQKDITTVEIRIGVPLFDVMKDEDNKDGTSDFLLLLFYYPCYTMRAAIDEFFIK